MTRHTFEVGRRAIGTVTFHGRKVAGPFCRYCGRPQVHHQWEDGQQPCPDPDPSFPLDDPRLCNKSTSPGWCVLLKGHDDDCDSRRR